MGTAKRTAMGIRQAAAVAATVATCLAGIAIIPAVASAGEVPLPAHWGARHAAKAPVVRSAVRHSQARRVVVTDPPPPAEGQPIPYGYHPDFASGDGDHFAYYAGSFHGGFTYRGIYWTQPYWGLGQWQRWW
jgi:hypothetical protein